MKKIPRRLALACSLFFCGQPLLAEDWPGWLGPRRDGSSMESVVPWNADPKPLWKLDVGAGHSSPVVSQGKVYLHQQIGKEEKEEVLCIDAKTGQIVWREAYDRVAYQNIFGNGPRATPSVVDGKVYTLGVTGILQCRDAETGKLIWANDLLKTYAAKNLFFGTSSSPLVMDGKVFLMPGGPEASQVALNGSTGKEVWKSGSDPASYAAPIALKQGDRSLLVYLTGAAVVAVDAGNGKEAWRIPFKDKANESSTTPIVSGNQMFVSSVTLGSMGIKLGLLDQSPVASKTWDNPKLTCYFGTPVSFGDSLYVVTGKMLPPVEANLHCVDPATGSIRWTQKNVGKYHATLMRTKDKLLMLEEFGNLVMIEPSLEGYKELKRSKICNTTWAHPALAEGVLFIRDDKQLLAVPLK